MAEPELFELAGKFLQAVAQGEQRAADRLATAYGDAHARILEDLDGITSRIEEGLAEAGLADASSAERAAWLRTEQPSWLFQQGRLESLAAGVEQQLGELTPALSLQVQDQQRRAITMARQSAHSLMVEAMGDTPEGANAPSFARLPQEAFAQLAGHLEDGSPLEDLLGQLPGQAGQEVAGQLLQGLALGENPNRIAARVQQALNGNRMRARTIARTETLRAYREATRRTYEANSDVVQGWTWRSAQGTRTCACCWAMHGSEHGVDERLDGHPNCRCAMVPITRSWEELLGVQGVEDTRVRLEPGADAFAKLPEADQLRILGPGKLKAYKAGKLELGDLVRRTDDPRWGPMRSEGSLRAALERAKLRAKGRKLPDLEEPDLPAPPAEPWMDDVHEARRGLPAPGEQRDVGGAFVNDDGTPTEHALRQEALTRRAGAAVDDEARRRMPTDLPDPAPLERRARAEADELGAVRRQLETTERDELQLHRRQVGEEHPDWHGGQVATEARQRLEANPSSELVSLRERTDEARARWRSTEVELAQARRGQVLAYRDALRSTLRDAGVELGPGTLAKGERALVYTKGGTGKYGKLVEAATEAYPRSWIQRGRGISLDVARTQRGFHQMTSRTTAKLRISEGARGFSGDPDGSSTAVHELGHHFEHSVPGVKAMQWVFHQRRTRTRLPDGSLGPQERPTRLGYGGEVAYRDEFLFHYTGKVYSGTPNGNFEVLTTAMENLWHGSHELDDDARAFVIGLLVTL